ncbi:hypothetical protein HOA55_00665 [archaeon]|jgi:hypothetical protein|nr:hypothetical protein [archaeon]MBT3578232.1 hypothetical protein [archaeon]MBT6819847.1 hypothetical protein [archaeon]MBT6955734.1 hypothetical protein [archaeon]MBT7025629.1 hypothetical protein [archaeon]
MIESAPDDDRQKILDRIYEIEAEGYVFLVDTHEPVYIPDRVALPCGRILDDSELQIALKDEGSKPFLRKAQELSDLYFAEGLEDERHESSTFLNDEDEEAAIMKYSNRA